MELQMAYQSVLMFVSQGKKYTQYGAGKPAFCNFYVLNVSGLL